MKKPMIEWILDVTNEDLSNRRIKSKKKASAFERLHHRIDDILFYCKSCNRVWQKNRKMMSREWESYPSNYIPIIGKQKKKCPNCKEKK
jgi:rubrerythrin